MKVGTVLLFNKYGVDTRCCPFPRHVLNSSPSEPSVSTFNLLTMAVGKIVTPLKGTSLNLESSLYGYIFCCILQTRNKSSFNPPFTCLNLYEFYSHRRFPFIKPYTYVKRWSKVLIQISTWQSQPDYLSGYSPPHRVGVKPASHESESLWVVSLAY